MRPASPGRSGSPLGVVVFVARPLVARERVLGRVTPADGDLVPEFEGAYRRILVPLKLGPIGEEVLGDRDQARRGARAAVVRVST